MAGLVPAIHVFVALFMLKSWMPGTRPGMTNSEAGLLPMQPELLSRLPGAPVVVRHLDVGRAQKREGVVDGVGEARYAADVRALADAFGADRVVWRRRRGPVGFPVRRFHRGRQEIVHERRRGDVAVVVVVDLLAHGDAESLRQATVNLAFDDHRVDAGAAIVERVE